MTLRPPAHIDIGADESQPTKPNRWHPTYRRVVLEPGFRVHRDHFYRPMLEISIVHILMLMRQNIIPADAGTPLVAACRELLTQDPSSLAYDERFEDLFFTIEHAIEQQVGPDAAGNMHVALSRNDLDTTMHRMVLRDETLVVATRLLRLRRLLIDMAEKHVHTVMLAHTHNQQAQPTTLGHYIAAVEAELAKDQDRLAEMWGRLNRSPLGAAALATSGFPIDRQHVADLLGFDGLVENSYEAVASGDHSAEYAAWAQLLLAHLSRFLADLLFWTTNEVSALRLDPSVIQISSIMPQKRNPVALEHLRAFSTRAYTLAAGIIQHMHNVPFGDINDVHDDIQPLLRQLTAHLVDVLELLTDVLRSATVDVDGLYRRAAESFAPITELADVLVREANLPFRTAHRIVSSVVEALTKTNRSLHQLNLELLNDIAKQTTGQPTGLTQRTLRDAIDPRHFVAVRRVRGGPAPDEMDRYLQEAAAKWSEDENSIAALSARLTAAQTRRTAAIAAALGEEVTAM